MLWNKNDGEPCALVSNIQKYTIHDGPGIRTEIFFKGCSLSCLWCSNPESIRPSPQLGVYPAKCLSLQKCSYCIKECPIAEQAPIRHDQSGVLHSISMSASCEGCYKCADVCPGHAIKLWGELRTTGELMKIVEEDRSFYDRSGGGVTLSGGEVMLQWELACMILKACKDASINTCVLTALNCQTDHMEAVYQHTDLVIADIKHMNSKKHKELTGSGNELILKNIKRTVELGKRLVIRTPIVFGYNADEESIHEIGAFLKNELSGKIIQYQLLPYRKIGIEKYDSLNQSYPLKNYNPPSREEWEAELVRLANMLSKEYGLAARAGYGSKL